MDCAKAMSGHITGLVNHIKIVSAECKFTHCVLHREAFAAKHLPEKLKEVLENLIFFLANNKNVSNFTEFKTQMGQNFNTLKIRIREYFPPLEKLQYDRIRHPFDADAADTNLTFEKKQLIEVSCDPTMKNKYLRSGTTL